MTVKAIYTILIITSYFIVLVPEIQSKVLTYIDWLELFRMCIENNCLSNFLLQSVEPIENMQPISCMFVQT